MGKKACIRSYGDSIHLAVMSEAARPLAPEETGEETPADTPPASGPIQYVTRPGPKGGQLRVGNPGNKGGPGVPPSKIRAAARELLFPRLEILSEIADGVTEIPLREKCPECGYEPTHEERVEALKDRVKPSDRVAAMRALEKLAMSGSISVDDLRDRMIRQVRTIRAYLAERGLTPEQVELLIELVHADWRS